MFYQSGRALRFSPNMPSMFFSKGLRQSLCLLSHEFMALTPETTRRLHHPRPSALLHLFGYGLELCLLIEHLTLTCCGQSGSTMLVSKQQQQTGGLPCQGIETSSLPCAACKSYPNFLNWLSEIPHPGLCVLAEARDSEEDGRTSDW